MKFIKLKQTSFETPKNKKKGVNSKGKMHKLNFFHIQTHCLEKEIIFYLLIFSTKNKTVSTITLNFLQD